jgi:hypothetical protein
MSTKWLDKLDSFLPPRDKTEDTFASQTGEAPILIEDASAPLIPKVPERRNDAQSIPENAQPVFNPKKENGSSPRPSPPRRAPLRERFAPKAAEPYGTISQLFADVRSAISTETNLSREVNSLLTYWAISTWFTEVMPLAPNLTISGDRHIGDLLLRALNYVCRNALLLSGGSYSSLLKIQLQMKATILIHQPDPTAKVVALIDCATRQGYLIPSLDGWIDLFGAKAIYVGANPNPDRMPECGLHIIASMGAYVKRAQGEQEFHIDLQRLQNRLYHYKLSHSNDVARSDFDTPSLHPRLRPIANALGSCIVGDAHLQTDLITLLSPSGTQQLADRAQTLEATCIEAILLLSRHDKQRVFVNEVAQEVNRLRKSRGETSDVSAEKVGHALKRAGLFTLRLSKDGNGLLLDFATLKLIREMELAYFGVASITEEDAV